MIWYHERREKKNPELSVGCYTQSGDIIDGSTCTWCEPLLAFDAYAHKKIKKKFKEQRN